MNEIKWKDNGNFCKYEISINCKYVIKRFKGNLIEMSINVAQQITLYSDNEFNELSQFSQTFNPGTWIKINYITIAFNTTF